MEKYLWNSDSYKNIRNHRARMSYEELSYVSFSIKYAVRTLNTFLAIDNKVDLKEAYLVDLRSGSWTIDICTEKEADTYFGENDLAEIQENLIEFCLSWATGD